MLRALFIALLLYSTPLYAAAECNTATEDKIKQTISEQPDKVVAVLDNNKVAEFFSVLSKYGYMTGTVSNVDHIYIVDAGKKPGYTGDNVWLWFVSDGCLISSMVAAKSVIINVLKEVV